MHNVKIEGLDLTVTTDNETLHAKLFASAKNYMITVWKVPQLYRANQLFIAPYETNGPEHIPACSLSDCVHLGFYMVEADETERALARKQNIALTLRDMFDLHMRRLVYAYPEQEIQSWAQQVKEAEAYTQDNNSPTPLLSSIATARGVPLPLLVQKILEKMKAYAEASGVIIGQKQAIEDLLEQAPAEHEALDQVMQTLTEMFSTQDETSNATTPAETTAPAAEMTAENQPDAPETQEPAQEPTETNEAAAEMTAGTTETAPEADDITAETETAETETAEAVETQEVPAPETEPETQEPAEG